MKRYLNVRFWILLLVLGGGQVLAGNPPTRILEADSTAVHVHANSVIVAEASGDLLRSTDGGINFAIAHQGVPADAFHSVHGSGDTVIAVGAGGWILRSADNGQSWSGVNAEAMLGALSAVATNGNGLWVAVGQHLGGAATQVSTDDGQNWTLHSVSGVYALTGIAWHPGGNQFVASGGDGFFSGSLHGSADGGNWSNIGVPSGTPMLRFVTSYGSNTLLSGGEQGIVLRSQGAAINFAAVEGHRPSETLRSAVSTGQGSWIVGGDQAILLGIPSASEGTRLLSAPLAAAGAIVSIANRGNEELLLAGAFADYPWGPPELHVDVDGEQLTLRVENARLGRTYRVQSSTNLSQWSDVGGTIRQATQRNQHWTLNHDATHRFFRVIVD